MLKNAGLFRDITGITAHTCKLVNNTRAKPARDRVFHAKQLAYRKGGKNQFNVEIAAVALDQVTNLFLSDNCLLECEYLDK